jgi:uncharacterized short protein YbdD (DUF466 family)
MEDDSVSLQACWRKAVQLGRSMIGVPDYDTYVAHLRNVHPDWPVPSYEQFFRERMQARYANGRGRCC